MIEKQTILDRIEITRNGTIQIRFAVLLVEDGVELASAWHRTALEPGNDINSLMAAVNTHLTQMGKAQVAASEISKVTALIPIVQDASVIKEYQDQVKIDVAGKKG